MDEHPENVKPLATAAAGTEQQKSGFGLSPVDNKTFVSIDADQF